MNVLKLKGTLQNAVATLPYLLSDQYLPRWLWFEVTSECNGRCRTCKIWTKPAPVNPLTPEELKRVLLCSLFKKVGRVMNSGGEPTLAKRLYDYLVVEHEVLPDARLQISSNGILAEKLVDVAENCLADGIKLDVGLSIDGVGKSHDYWRGINGNFERLDWLLHRLVKLRNIYPDLSIGLGSTLTAETVKRADEMVRYCNKFGATFMWHWYNRNSFYGNSKIDLMPDMSAGKTLQKVMGKGLYVKMWMDYLRTGVVPKFKCFSLKSFLCIKCNGDVVPCLNKWDQSAGNVRKENPLQIWTGRQAESLRNEIQECTGCLNSWCVGWSLQSQPHVILLDRVKGRLRG